MYPDLALMANRIGGISHLPSVRGYGPVLRLPPTIMPEEFVIVQKRLFDCLPAREALNANA